MIRSVPIGAEFSFRGRPRLGLAPSLALNFNPITAGISAGIGLATTAVAGWMQSIQLSHNADTATTLIVNGLAEELQNLKDAYLSEHNPSCADQRAALDAFDGAWLWLQSPAACGNPNYGRAGNACISDRAPGGPYPWRTYYRDPIANDPRMAALGCDTGNAIFLPSPITGNYSEAGITSTGGSSTTGAPPPTNNTPPAPTPTPTSLPTIAGIPLVYAIPAGALIAFLASR